MTPTVYDPVGRYIGGILFVAIAATLLLQDFLLQGMILSAVTVSLAATLGARVAYTITTSAPLRGSISFTDDPRLFFPVWMIGLTEINDLGRRIRATGRALPGLERSYAWSNHTPHYFAGFCIMAHPIPRFPSLTAQASFSFRNRYSSRSWLWSGMVGVALLVAASRRIVASPGSRDPGYHV